MRRWLAFGALGGILLVLLLPGVPTLSYVYSDSMEPTISVGDGYVIVPAGHVEPGDIVTFDSPVYDDYVTHRVVEEVDGGYLTQGDNNPSTDQAAGHPVVTREAIVGRVLTVGGTPVVIPHLEAVASAVSTYWPGLLAVLLVGGALADRDSSRARDVVRLRDLAVPLVVTAVLGSAAVMAFAPPTYAMSLVAVASDSADGRLVPVGETAVRTLEVADAPRFTYRFVEGSGVTVTDTVAAQGPDSVTVSIPPHEAAGGFSAAVRTYHYPAVLPRWVVAALHGVHPFAAALASILTLLAPLAVLTWFAVDGKTPLEWRSRSRSRTRQGGLRGWLR